MVSTQLKLVDVRSVELSGVRDDRYHSVEGRDEAPTCTNSCRLCAAGFEGIDVGVPSARK